MLLLRILFATLAVIAGVHALARLPIDYAIARTDIAEAQMTLPLCDARPSTTAVNCLRNRRLSQRWAWELALQYTTAHMFTHLPYLPENRTLEALATNGWAVCGVLLVISAIVSNVFVFCRKASSAVASTIDTGTTKLAGASHEAAALVQRLLHSVDKDLRRPSKDV